MELITSAPELISAVPEPQPPRRRKRVRRRTLTRIDMRGRLGKRIRELEILFSGASGGDRGELSPVRKLKIEHAARLSALAEQALGDHLRGIGTSDLVRLERAAASAVRALGELEPKPKPPSLAEVLASHR
jgi:hypothetical protein